MNSTKQAILEALKTLTHPDSKKNIIESGCISEIVINDLRVFFSITADTEEIGKWETLRSQAESLVKKIVKTKQVMIVITLEKNHTSKTNIKNSKESPEQNFNDFLEQRRRIPGVKTILAVASAKGGVGKSTTALNLALSFASLNYATGLLDADIHGPSLPLMLGIEETPEVTDKHFEPIRKFGLKVMSTGFLVDKNTPIIWRGPMMVSALMQMLFQVAWGDLDLLIVDMPPGTGDIQLTISRKVCLDGAIIISTPQELALMDSRKSLSMFQKLSIPLVGIIENMSYFITPDTGKRYDIFGKGGAEKEALQQGVPFLGSIPLEIETREHCDQGTPLIIAKPESNQTKIYKAIAEKICNRLFIKG